MGYEILTRRPHCPCLVVPASTPASHEAVSWRAVDLRQKGLHCEAFNQVLQCPRRYCGLGPGSGTAHAAQRSQPELRVAMLNHGSPSWCAWWYQYTHIWYIYIYINIYIYIHIWLYIYIYMYIHVLYDYHVYILQGCYPALLMFARNLFFVLQP